MLDAAIIILGLAALLNGFVFGGSLPFSLIAAVVALLVMLGRLLLRRRTRPALRTAVGAAGLACLLLVGFICGLAPAPSGLLAYEQSLAKIGRLVEQGGYGQAGGMIEELQTRYNSDAIYLLQAQAALGREDLGDAAAALGRVGNRHTKTYYILQGEIFRQRSEYAGLQSLYVEAASLYPSWSEAQRLAGTQAAVNKDYTVAEYFLLRAYEQVPGDPVAPYYLGVIRYEQNAFSEANAFFAESLARSPDDQIAGFIAWYRDQMGGDAP